MLLRNEFDFKFSLDDFQEMQFFFDNLSVYEKPSINLLKIAGFPSLKIPFTIFMNII